MKEKQFNKRKANQRKTESKKKQINKRKKPKKMGSAMSVQEENFNNQAKKHYGNRPLAYCVSLWQGGENNKMIYNEVFLNTIMILVECQYFKRKFKKVGM